MDKKTISTMKKMFDDIMHITEDGTVEFWYAGAMNPDITGAGAQNGACSRENGVRQGQNAGISQQETLADDEPEDNEFLDFSFGM